MKHRKKLMISLWHIMMIIIFVSCMSFFALISFWSLQPFGKPVVEFPKGLKVETKQVYQGGEMIISAPYCKNVNTKSTIVTRSFQDDLTYFLPILETNVEVGCVDDYKAIIKIPENLPADTYTYKVNFTYEINHIKTVNYSFESDKFEVLRKLTPETIAEVCKVTNCNLQ